MTADGGSERCRIPAGRAVVPPLGDGAPGSLCSCSEVYPSLHFTEQWERVLLQRLVAASSQPNGQRFFFLPRGGLCVFKMTLLVGIPAFTPSALGFSKHQTHNIHDVGFKISSFFWDLVVLVFFFPFALSPFLSHNVLIYR